MRLFTPILFALLVCQFGFAQTGTIEGSVWNLKQYDAIRYAEVSLTDSSHSTTTNWDGEFELQNIPEGLYDLRIRNKGFADTTLTAIRVLRDSTITLTIDYNLPCQFDYRIKTCPVCEKEDDIIPLSYGKPSEDLMQKEKDGLVRLAGCEMTGCDPSWYCKRDDVEF